MPHTFVSYLGNIYNLSKVIDIVNSITDIYILKQMGDLTYLKILEDNKYHENEKGRPYRIYLYTILNIIKDRINSIDSYYLNKVGCA